MTREYFLTSDRNRNIIVTTTNLDELRMVRDKLNKLEIIIAKDDFWSDNQKAQSILKQKNMMTNLFCVFCKKNKGQF